MWVLIGDAAVQAWRSIQEYEDSTAAQACSSWFLQMYVNIVWKAAGWRACEGLETMQLMVFNKELMDIIRTAIAFSSGIGNSPWRGDWGYVL